MLFRDCATALASKLQGTRAKAESSAADGAGHQNWPWQDCRALSLRTDLYLTYAHYCWLWERMELIFKSLHISCKLPLATCKDWTPIWNVFILLPKTWAESRWLGSRSLKLAQRMNLNRWRRLITVSSYYFMHAFQALQWPPGVSTFAIVWGSFLYGFLESLGGWVILNFWWFGPSGSSTLSRFPKYVECKPGRNLFYDWGLPIIWSHHFSLTILRKGTQVRSKIYSNCMQVYAISYLGKKRIIFKSGRVHWRGQVAPSQSRAGRPRPSRPTRLPRWRDDLLVGWIMISWKVVGT